MTFRLKSLFRSGKPVLGTFIFSSDAASTEIAAEAGFDFVIVDREHTALGWSDVLSHARAARATGISLLVRTRGPDGDEVARALDIGAEGAVIPHFGLDRARSVDCVRAARFAPDGHRGTCTGTRSARYSLHNFAELVQEANREAVIVAQIEDAEVVPILEDLLDGVEVDAIMPGLADLSTSLGKPGQFAAPEVLEAANAVFDCAGRRQLPLGLYVANAGEVGRWAGRSAQFYVYAIDYKVIAEGYRAAIEALRSGTSARRG